MIELLPRFVVPIVVSLCALPVAAAVAARMARWRRDRGIAGDVAWRFSVAEVAMVVGTAPWIWMILTPLPDQPLVHLIPFVDLGQQWDVGLGFLVVQVGGNLVVFAAFGAAAPVRWVVGPWLVTGLAAVGSTVVEVLQYTLDLGRVSSIDDVLVNTTGAALGALLSRPWWRSRPG